MANPYKRMYVLSEEEYLEYKKNKSPNAQCPVDGRVYPNENILAHHLKTHVDGFKCNICGKVFKSKKALATHLKHHKPQVQPSKHSIFDSTMPAMPKPSMPPTDQPTAPSIQPKKHKHRSALNFNSKHWLTLK